MENHVRQSWSDIGKFADDIGSEPIDKKYEFAAAWALATIDCIMRSC
jgi:hypothetical protein